MRRLAALTAVLLGIGGVVAVATPAAAATTDLVINEVESDGDTTDWVELYNPTGDTIDASGLRVTDNDSTRTFTIPASSTVPAGGFLAVDVSVDVPRDDAAGDHPAASFFLLSRVRR